MKSIPTTLEEYREWWRSVRPDIPFGKCWCGCEQDTPPARQRDKRLNYFKGEPVRYVRGHGNSKPRISDKNYTATDTGHNTPCWLWNRYLTNAGYPFLYERGTGKPYLAHRAYYEHYRGPIPPGLEIDHLCRRPSCVNPEHMEPVTAAINQQRGSAAKLTKYQVVWIRRLNAMQRYTHAEIAKMFSVSRSRISSICRGDSWKEN